MNPIYCSTGAFTGRINGRNLNLLAEYHDKLHCDGFELMLFEDCYERLPAVLPSYKGINIPVIHSDKTIGDYLSDDDGFATALAILQKNLVVCETVGAKKMVFHGWGKPKSDANPARTVDRILSLRREAQKYGVDLLAENCCCVNRDPLTLFDLLIQADPSIHFIVDTRPAQFHRQLPETLQSVAFREHTVHMHINDYAGGYKNWNALYPIPQPKQGNIDWDMVFRGLKDYKGSITLEAPSMLAEGVDYETLNRSLDFIRLSLQ